MREEKKIEVANEANSSKPQLCPDDLELLHAAKEIQNLYTQYKEL